MLALLVLGAFVRLTWQLDAKSLWWDESLSLLRAESGWTDLLAGRIVLTDGINSTPTIDQHPFGFFVILGLLVRVAGTSEFILRFPAAIAGTLLVPAVWALAHLLARERAAPRSSPQWAALLAAASPFFLWYGQEARMYTLMALLGLLSTYCALRWTEVHLSRRLRLRFLAGYAAGLLLLVSSHYLSFLILPVHALLIYTRLAGRNRRLAVTSAVAPLVAGLGVVLLALLLVAQQPGTGTNFSPVSLRVLVSDLLNAFTLGLSVDLDQVRWLDYLAGAVALLGAAWSLWPRRGGPTPAWVLPAWILVPVAGLLLIQIVMPVYMNARHMSLISGAYLLLLAAGLGLLWQRRRWIGALLILIMVAGMGYSTVNYFTQPQYDKDHFRQLGDYLWREVQPGDGIVVIPAEMTRLFRYYLPLDAVAGSVPPPGQAGIGTGGWQALPLLSSSWEQTEQTLDAIRGRYRRVWLVSSGMVPFSKYQEETREWLPAKTLLVRDEGFLSNTFLNARLFLPETPLRAEMPAGVQYPLAADYGGMVRLAGLEIGKALRPGSAVPVTLYWQSLQPISRHYKYVLRLVEDGPKGGTEVIWTTEHEPYNGAFPTPWWPPGQFVVEYSQVVEPVHAPGSEAEGSKMLTLQMYDAETLEKLPLSGMSSGAGSVRALDEFTLVVPYEKSAED